MAHKLVIYRAGRTKQLWKWRLDYRDKTMARADYKYESPSAARRAFNSTMKAITGRVPVITSEVE